MTNLIGKSGSNPNDAMEKLQQVMKVGNDASADSKKITENNQKAMTGALVASADASRTDPTTAQNQASGRASEPRSKAAEASAAANADPNAPRAGNA